jgi:2-polyprenyl-3-methyl-5-hydroxy-6-metoxy-1,4-benzoquinol methylase
MSLGRVTDTDGRPIPLPGDAPFAAVDLAPLVGVAFHLPCEDPWVRESGTPAHGYLDGARQGWLEHPEWMDSLAAESPVRLLKEASRDVYLHWWRPWLNAKRVLDLGCGVGRFTTWLLDQGADVWGVDPDVESLRRCVWSSAGRAGRLEVHWSSARQLPDVHDLDAIVACEVLCYVPDMHEVLPRLVERLRPGGALLLSMEARWAWATAPDAPGGSIAEALAGSGVISRPGDRWVRTMERDELTEVLTRAGLNIELIQPTHYVPEGPLEGVVGEVSLEGLLEYEEAARVHPVWSPLNRVWTVVATRPHG